MMSTTPPLDSEYINQLPPDPENDARSGYEPDGSSCCGDSNSEDDALKLASYTKWSNNLPSLLNSKSGMKAFNRFLEKTNKNHFEMLRFLAACKGVSESSEKTSEKEIMLKVIFQNFILRDLFETDRNERDVIVRRFEEYKLGVPLPLDIFNDICRDIEDTMKREMYPNFLAYQAEKIQNKNKSCCRGNHDCKKHFFEQRRSTHFQVKPAGRGTDFNLEFAKSPEPETFYKVLMERLEKVKNEEEDRTKEYRSQDEIPPLRDVLARVISEKVEESNYEDILDQHIDRVLPDNENHASSNYDLHKYSDSRKFTLAKNPAMYKEQHVIPHPYNGTGPVRRKSKDLYSIDSGFGTGYQSDDTRRSSDYGSVDRYQPRKMNEVWASRQTLDSGIGTIPEDNEYAQYNEKMCERRDKYRMGHINDATKYRMSHPSEADKYRSYHAGEGDARYKHNFNTMSYRERHNYINDIPSVSMNSLHSNDSYAQVEEERTYKLRNEMRQKLKSPSWSGNFYPNQGNPPGYPKHSSKMENVQQRVEETPYTMVVYNFNDEKMPYLVKVPGNRITLKQFKDYMPKKGNYRYFFITPIEDLGAVQEEITDEHRLLPLWEGKVDARIKAIK